MGERPDRCSPFLPEPGDDPAMSLRSGMNQADPRTEISEDDTGDKAPKRAKSIKKVPKAEVRAGPELGEMARGCDSRLSPLSSCLLPTATGFQDAEDPAQEEDLRGG